jgi:alkylhydroperoxidase/carboxymuconolactone decarboxylase family protein YurZ
MGRYDELVDNQRRAVLESQGVTERSLRQAAAARAAALGGGPVAEASSEEILKEIPESLRAYVDSIVLHAYRITDEDIAALRREWSEDEIFEVSVATAVGAGLARLERGLSILRGTGR